MAYTVTIEEEKKEIASRYKDMLKDTYQTLSNDDKLMIRKAFDIAAARKITTTVAMNYVRDPGGVIGNPTVIGNLDLCNHVMRHLVYLL